MKTIIIVVGYFFTAGITSVFILLRGFQPVVDPRYDVTLPNNIPMQLLGLLMLLHLLRRAWTLASSLRTTEVALELNEHYVWTFLEVGLLFVYVTSLALTIGLGLGGWISGLSHNAAIAVIAPDSVLSVLWTGTSLCSAVAFFRLVFAPEMEDQW